MSTASTLLPLPLLTPLMSLMLKRPLLQLLHIQVGQYDGMPWDIFAMLLTPKKFPSWCLCTTIWKLYTFACPHTSGHIINCNCCSTTGALKWTTATTSRYNNTNASPTTSAVTCIVIAACTVTAVMQFLGAAQLVWQQQYPCRSVDIWVCLVCELWLVTWRLQPDRLGEICDLSSQSGSSGNPVFCWSV